MKQSSGEISREEVKACLRLRCESENDAVAAEMRVGERRRCRLLRHCEEPSRRSNPESFRGGILDCFATLAMTGRERVRHPSPSP